MAGFVNNDKMLLAECFADIISAHFNENENVLRVKYDYKYEVRVKYGMLDHDRLEDEWRFEYLKLVKQRNWLWYLMKTGQFVELDAFFNTDFTFEQVDLRLRVDWAVQEKKFRDRFKYINRKPKFINFSKSNLPVDDLGEDVEECTEEECAKSLNFKNTYRRCYRSFESNIDNNPYRPCSVEDNRDYNKLFQYSLSLRSIIESLEFLRKRLSNKMFGKNSIQHDDIELDTIKFQSGGPSTPIKIQSDVVADMLRFDNRPLCCSYCPTIVCMRCFGGEGCCLCDIRYKFHNDGATCRFCNGPVACWTCWSCSPCCMCAPPGAVVFQNGPEQDVGGNTEVVQTSTAHNVVLTETEETQQDTTGRGNKGWSKFVSSDVVSNMDTLVDRWFRVGTYTWNTTMARNTTIISIDLPRTAIFSGATTCDQPNKIPFRIHRFWRGDMVVKIHINCNKFQIGQLQCAWYYQPKADMSFPLKNNVYTRSGTHHVVISAAPNNEVEFRIPFKAYKSMYHTKVSPGDGRDLPLDLGTLFISVLSPLKTTGETSPRCSFTVFVRFDNNEFTGMLAGNIDTPTQLRDDEIAQFQMDGIGTIMSSALPIVEKMLTSSANDCNRDNPPVNSAPSYLVPTASHSWAFGTDVAEPVHNLRLSGKAQTKHPDVDLDEMKIDILKRKYMLLDIFSWSQQNSSGTLLWDMPANPIPPKDRIHVTRPGGINTLASYQLTPVGFISSLYQYWRGSLELRFDIVASQFHSGKLLLAYIPGIAEGDTVTIEQARASPNIVISLDNAMSYTWIIPYVSDRVWWARRYSGESVTNNTRSPSKIFVFVLNELVLGETVPDSLEILVYMRGGEDMEFSVPVQPCVGLGFDNTYIASRNDNNVFPTSTTDTYYAGNWHSVPQCLVWRHAATSEAVARFTEPILDRPAFYSIPSNFAPMTNISTVGGQMVAINRCIFLRGVGFSEFIGIPIYWLTSNVGATTRIEAIARAALANNYTVGTWMADFVRTAGGATDPNNFGFIGPNIPTTANQYGGGKSIVWTATTVSSLDFDEDVEIVFNGNREQSLALVDNTQSLTSTGSGFLTFGERFLDFKDLCRRYQMYGWISVPAAQIERDPGACSVVFPVLPQGLELDLNTPTQVNQVWNRAREGHIPLISSLYRFYRGSIRIRIIVSNGDGLIMWVQHRPDRKLNRSFMTLCTQVSTAEAVFNHTYGVYMQSMDVNSIVELEIPFYQSANFGLLQRPQQELTDWSSFYSLGELSVGFFGNTPTAPVRLSVYYSLADDCRFSTFQGVPPLVLLDDLPEFQGFGDLFSPKRIGTEAAVGAAETIKNDIKPMLSEALDTFNKTISDTYSSVKENISSLDMSGKLAAIGSQIVHAFNNPSASTIAISVVSILITLGLITYSMFDIIKTYVTTIWEWISQFVSSNKDISNELHLEGEDADTVKFSGEKENNAVTGFLSVICGGLCTLFGMKQDCEKYKCSSDMLFKNIDKGMKLSNVCFVFFRNLMSCIADMKAWIVARIYPGFNAAELLLEGRDIITKWVEYSQSLTDPRVSLNIKYNKELHDKLLDCYAFGKILKVKAIETQYPAVIQLINTTFDRLHKLHVELMAQGINPQVRKLPFVIYNFGPPECGKSEMTNSICSELCTSEGITTETNLMCVLNSASKFWDNCDRQPCLVIDDVFSIRKGQMLEEQIAAIFQIVSPVVLVPPKAAVEDKGRPYNPEIVVMNSNIDFFRTDICDEVALWRRRDILIHTELDLEFKKEGCRHCEENIPVNGSLPADVIPMLADFHHLKFRYTYDVKKGTDKDHIQWYPTCQSEAKVFLKYKELIVELKRIFKINRETENIKFARRVERNNISSCTRISSVANMENLEKLWNDAVSRRKMCDETYRNATLQAITSSFAHQAHNAWSEKKHGVLKCIYDCIRPYNNPYFLKNPNCSECMRIKYQCVGCSMKVEKTRQNFAVDPSIPSTSSISVCDDLFENVDASIDILNNDTDTNDSIPSFHNKTDLVVFDPVVNLELNTNATEWLASLNLYYPPHILASFKTFCSKYHAELLLKIRLYPKSSRGTRCFKNICESICGCHHNPSVNQPYVFDGNLCFLNPSNPERPTIISNLSCSKVCFMQLPWKNYEACVISKSLQHTEEWMEGMIEKEVYEESYLEKVFCGMLKYVYDFYYNQMKPAVKSVFSFFSSLKGWILGISFLSLLFSTTIMGVGAYEAMTTGSIGVPVQPGTSNVQSHASAPKNALVFQSKSYADTGKGRVNRVVKPRIKIAKSNKVSFNNSQQFSVVETKLCKNIVSIDTVIIEDEGSARVSQSFGLMLKDQQMLILSHYYDYWHERRDRARFYFNAPNIPRNSPHGIEICNLFDLEVEWFSSKDNPYLDSNFGILSLPKTIPAFGNISKFIAKSSEHQYINSSEVFLFSCFDNRSRSCVLDIKKKLEVSERNDWVKLDECYQYQYSERGLCGSILLCSSLERPIIGMHFAGSKGVGYAEALVSESFTDVPTSGYNFTSHEMYMDDGNPKVEFSTMLFPQGTMPDKLSHNQGGVSQYVPSLIHGVMPVDTEPNPLKLNDPRLPPNCSPLRLGCEHMGKPPKEFERSLLEHAAEDLNDTILNTVKPIRIKIDKISLQDAICGNVAVKGFEPLEWSSSEGFPLKSIRPKNVKGKRWLFKLEENSDGYKLLDMHGELKRQLYLCENLRSQGIRVPTIFVDCLKDTCIDSEKCKIPGKTRIFSISPVQYTIAFKQYFGDFLASYQNCRIDAEHGIGVNVDSMEWSDIANYITKYSPYIVAGDYKNFGPSLMLSCVEKCFDVIINWYARYDPNPERQLIRRVLLSEILFAKHLCLNVVYGVPCGIPSGSPITTPLNSMVNSLYLRCAWYSITKQPFNVMHDNVKILTYGDDVCINVSHKYIEFFNTSSLNKFFSNYDIIFTDIDKSENIVEYRTLDNVTFLKRGFLRHPSRKFIYLAPIDEQSIRKCVNWIMRKGDPRANTLENCVQACELAFGHGPVYYNRIKDILSLECMKKLNMSFRVPSWTDKSNVCFN